MPGSESTKPALVTNRKGLAPGLPGIWSTALATLLVLVMLALLLWVVAVNAFGWFWPAAVWQAKPSMAGRSSGPRSVARTRPRPGWRRRGLPPPVQDRQPGSRRPRFRLARRGRHPLESPSRGSRPDRPLGVRRRLRPDHRRHHAGRCRGRHDGSGCVGRVSRTWCRRSCREEPAGRETEYRSSAPDRPRGRARPPSNDRPMHRRRPARRRSRACRLGLMRSPPSCVPIWTRSNRHWMTLRSISPPAVFGWNQVQRSSMCH